MGRSGCVVNISRKGRRQRAVVGAAMALVVASGLLLFAQQDYPVLARLVFLLPLFLLGLGLFQAQTGTWVALAARGTRDLGDGEQTIEDPSEQAALRRQARQVTLRSGLLAVLGTLAILVLPL